MPTNPEHLLEQFYFVRDLGYSCFCCMNTSHNSCHVRSYIQEDKNFEAYGYFRSHFLQMCTVLFNTTNKQLKNKINELKASTSEDVW